MWGDAIARWRRRLAGQPVYEAPAGEVDRARRMVFIQCLLFPLIPVFAAALARGIGYAG